ncbi:hypothetical protein AMTR_s00070p00069050 [Amborella trichopoda]|uniref:Uncharacterized protein n=1 Tax=Amborella trichopoda TaxID=13333 RepID=U5DGH9_AMBTC|nr:hypothetical protein AMTR_s00070p00069050 [Amborella trichopoda]
MSTPLRRSKWGIPPEKSSPSHILCRKSIAKKKRIETIKMDSSSSSPQTKSSLVRIPASRKPDEDSSFEDGPSESHMDAADPEPPTEDLLSAMEKAYPKLKCQHFGSTKDSIFSWFLWDGFTSPCRCPNLDLHSSARSKATLQLPQQVFPLYDVENSITVPHR